ncbi:MAG TPA: WhiB family transcriptional regulator [Aldersonia sp.]
MTATLTSPKPLTVDEERYVASYRRRAHHPLPPAREDDWNWQLQARCRGMDPSIFFPKIDRGPALARHESAAKAICSGCPVVAACRRHALAVGERYGVWGGLTTTERALQDRRR